MISVRLVSMHRSLQELLTRITRFLLLMNPRLMAKNECENTVQIN